MLVTVVMKYGGGRFEAEFNRKATEHELGVLDKEINSSRAKKYIGKRDVFYDYIDIYPNDDVSLKDAKACLVKILKKAFGKTARVKFIKWKPVADQKAIVSEVLRDEAALDPTGPAAYIVSGGLSELRRGWR